MYKRVLQKKIKIKLFKKNFILYYFEIIVSFKRYLTFSKFFILFKFFFFFIILIKSIIIF